MPIGMAARGWHPVGVACWRYGSDCLGSGPFTGVFEGNGNVIRNLYINRDRDGVGLVARPLV